MEFLAYKDWSPTPWDAHGIGAKDYQDWLVVPYVGINRDSSERQGYRFASVAQALRARETGAEILHFGHWACGWFDIIVVPDTPENRAILEDEGRILEEGGHDAEFYEDELDE